MAGVGGGAGLSCGRAGGAGVQTAETDTGGSVTLDGRGGYVSGRLARRHKRRMSNVGAE